MQKKLIAIVIAAIWILPVFAQTAEPPDLNVAAQIGVLVTKIGLPVDSARNDITAFGRFSQIRETGAFTFFQSKDQKVIFGLKKDDAGNIQMIICDMPDIMLSTAKKAISYMEMSLSDAKGPPGYIAYGTSKYTAFLNPEQREGYLELILAPR